MATNPDYLWSKEERKNEGFFKVLQSVDVSSENMRALPLDFASNFSNKELSSKMKIKTQWGSSWEVGISKNPRFYFMEKSGWEKFVRDNALGKSEFLTFIHKGKMRFSVNIYKQDGKEMIQPPQSSAHLASSSRINIEQEDDKTEETVVFSELNNRGPTASSNGGGTNQRKLNLGKQKKAEKSFFTKRAEKVVSAPRDCAGASSSTGAAFTIFISKSYCFKFLRIPSSVAKDYMPKQKTTVKIHHSDGTKTWDVVYVARRELYSFFCAGWNRLVKEYPIALSDICEFTLIKPDELRLVVSHP